MSVNKDIIRNFVSTKAFNNKVSMLLQDVFEKCLFYIPRKDNVSSLEEIYYKNIICKIAIIQTLIK